MRLEFVPVDFKLQFLSPAQVDANPLFVLRSMMGKHLHSMCCISRSTRCCECMYHKTCAYAFLFETILPQENTILPGTDRASHPFSLSKRQFQRENPIAGYDFTITLFGKASEYLPYIYAAFVRSGKEGIFKGRTPFVVEDVQVGGNSILIEENKLSTDYEKCEWTFDSRVLKDGARPREVFVELKSPLRFKFGGKYGTDFAAADFMGCLFRRAKTMCSLYGDFGDERYSPTADLEITERNVRWVNFRHYSARQKTRMELGGAVGHLKLSGCFTPFELALLEFNKVANAGKNTNFGLGQMDYWKRQEGER